MFQYSYIPNTGSPDDTNASVFSGSIVTDFNDAYFQYQHIENNLMKGGVDRAHLKHDSEGAPKNEGNVLCLSKNMHFMFDGFRNGTHESKPVIKIDGTKGDLDIPSGRTRIDLIITFYPDHREHYDLVKFLLKDGSGVCEVDGMPALTSFVFVKNSEVFLENLLWKAGDTERKWESDNELFEPAVD
jgi:hypothetical protein